MRPTHCVLVALLFAFVASPDRSIAEQAATEKTATEKTATEKPTAEKTTAEQLHDLIDIEWELRLRESPLLATSVGDRRFNDRLPKVGLAEEARQADLWRGVLERLEKIDPSALDLQDRINFRMLQRELRGRVEEYEIGHYRFPFNADSGFHIHFARLPSRVPLATTEDYENYIARLNAFPAYLDGYLELLRDAVEHGMTQPRVVLEGYEVTIDSHVVDDLSQSVFFKPFEDFPSTVPSADRERLRAAGEVAVRGSIVPGYRKLSTFFREEYLPAARETLGASEMPGGREYYAQRVREYTTLDLTAEEIHQIGLAEVARIRGEMLEVIESTGFEGSFADFLAFLRTDPRFYAETAEELLKQASYLSKRMDAQLPALFGRLPRTPYGVAPVPDHLAPKYTGGRYVPTSPGSTRPGYYWVNTYNLKSRPLYVLEALTLHEAVPGHHLQGALTQELEDLPLFRRHTYLSAFGEGWGLYSERLGLEAGFYTDPYSNFGRLTYEMWRACRLVVDTGIHAFGWTREQTIEYLAERTALSLHEITTETDRYISWPAQALSYKLGELKIRELRARAEQALGTDFDIRAFHDALLANGAVPLDVLEEVVEVWIAERKSS